MLLVVSKFANTPEVFVPQDRKQGLDMALGAVYNVQLEQGHAFPWYQLRGSSGVLKDLQYVSDVLHEVVAAYDL